MIFSDNFIYFILFLNCCLIIIKIKNAYFIILIHFISLDLILIVFINIISIFSKNQDYKVYIKLIQVYIKQFSTLKSCLSNMEPDDKPKLKTCTVLGPTPKNQFGPKAKTNIPAFNQEFLHADSNKKLEWSRSPENVLVVKKIDIDTIAPFKKCVDILIKKFNLSVYVEKSVLEDEDLLKDSSFSSVLKGLKVFEKGDRSTSSIDLIICLGGDGTLLYAASLFQHSMPPIIPFHMGSLGFMTSHKIESFEETLVDVLAGKALLMLRSRLRCNLKK